MRRLSTAWRPVIASVLVLAQVNACTHWKVQRVSPEVLLSRERPGKIRVDRKGPGSADSAQHSRPHSSRGYRSSGHASGTVLHEPRLVGDSIVGIRVVKGHETAGLFGQTTSTSDTTVITVALTDIEAIAVRRPDPVKIVAGFLLIPAALWGILACMYACGD